MDSIHALFDSIILDPTDRRNYERLDALCYVVWEYCIEHGTQPWSWCWDRYCSCKVSLAESEPDVLPFD